MASKIAYVIFEAICLKKRKMTPIVISFTSNYFVPVLVCLNSLIKASDKKESFKIICLLKEPLDEKKQNMLSNLWGERLRFRYIIIDGRLDGIKVDKRFSEASLYRMILPDLLPEYDKVIYHDCDIIIRQDLSKLYREFDLEDKYLGVVFEATLPHQYDMVRSVGCEPGEYFNSGFLLMNLSAMRQNNVAETLISEAKNTHSMFLDQDVLNKVCKNNCIALPVEYNFNRTMILPQYKKTFLKYYTQEDFERGIKRGNIHYTGGKPWNEYTVMFSLWWDNFMDLPKDVRKTFSPNIKLIILYRLEKCYLTNKMLSLAKYLKRILKK